MKRLLLAILALPLMAGAAERVVTIGGDVTEIAWALGAGQDVVARDSTSLHPDAVKKLPDVGYLRQLNAEGILAMRPTLVLVSAQAQPSMALKQVESSKVKVVTVPAENSLDSIDAKVAAVANALGKTAAGDKLRKELHDQLAAIPAKPLDKKVLFIMSHGA
ncbi:Hemin-binding periplasmic protein hmuT precursor [Cedecea neteri]|uniref:Hemin-binding periplasmic protein hmuT n=1 Tax=Cedecea neteri TaxID=158822 RepID=A0A2X3J0J1_9ENTR|nr:Hemin-binding periplasmic protein hmuT precursor [Cedecea neteri]